MFERSNEKTKGRGVRKKARDLRSLSLPPSVIVFSFDFGSAFVRLYTLLFETQTKKMPATQCIHTLGIIWLKATIDFGYTYWIYEMETAG